MGNQRSGGQDVLQRSEPINDRLIHGKPGVGKIEPAKLGKSTPALTAPAQGDQANEQDSGEPNRPGRIGWARLLKRVFDIDMSHCPNCGQGQLKILAPILERAAIEKILTHLGIDPQPPPRGQARMAQSDQAW